MQYKMLRGDYIIYLKLFSYSAIPRSAGVPGINESHIAAHNPATAMGVFNNAQIMPPIDCMNALPVSCIKISRLLATQPGSPNAIKNANPTIKILRWLCMSALNKT